jgi:hypothetical protein
MVFTPRLEETRVAPSGPRALDVLKRFPLSWKRDGAIHSIEIHRGRMSDERVANFFRMNDAQKRPYVETLKRDLLAALASCADCVVSAPSSNNYLCTVRLL